MLQEITFSPATLVLLIPIVAWLVWAIRRLTCRGLCDCHGAKGKKGRKGAVGAACAHCGAACPSAAMAEHLKDLADTPNLPTE